MCPLQVRHGARHQGYNREYDTVLGSLHSIVETDNYNLVQEMSFSKVQGQWNQTRVLLIPDMQKGNSQGMFFGRAVSAMTREKSRICQAKAFLTNVWKQENT